jgi:hypothetical protein
VSFGDFSESSRKVLGDLRRSRGDLRRFSEILEICGIIGAQK